MSLRSRCGRGSSCLAFLLVYAVTAPAIATDKIWILNGTANNWSQPNGWSPVGLPQAGDIIHINLGAGAPVGITYDVTGTGPTYQYLELNNSGGGSSETTLTLPNNTNFATSLEQYIGTLSRGHIVQTGGSNTVGASGIYLGNTLGTRGTYDFSGGTLTTTNINIGHLSGGTGVLNVSNGTLTASGTIKLNSALNTQFNFSGGTINVGDLDLSTAGSEFNWTAGTLHITGAGGATLGDTAATSLGSGVVTIDTNRTLNVDKTLKIQNTVGTQLNLVTGGTLSVGALDLSTEASRFNWTGGTLNVTGAAGATLGDASSTSLGSTFTVDTGKLLKVGPLKINNTSGTQFNLTDGEVDATSIDTSGNAGRFNWTAGTLQINGAANIDSAGVFTPLLTIDSNKVFKVQTDLSVGTDGTGTLTQTGGQVVVATFGLLQHLTLGANSGSSGTYNLRGGSLLMCNFDICNGVETVGGAGAGLFDHSAGSNSAGNLDIGTHGTYQLSGDGSMSIGQPGSSIAPGQGGVTVAAGGTFSQSGGTAAFAALNLSGLYQLSAGNLTVGGETGVSATKISSGGSFTQTGGSATNYELDVDGSYALSSGTLAVRSLSALNGTFSQTGGSFSTGNAQISGSYSLSGNGQLQSTFGIRINPGGSLQQTGGDITAALSSIVNDGTQTLSGGTINTAFNGQFGAFQQTGGVFNTTFATWAIGYQQSGGIANTPTFLVNAPANNPVLLSGGVLNAGSLVVGQGGMYTGGPFNAPGYMSISGSGVFNGGVSVTNDLASPAGLMLAGGTINATYLNFEGAPQNFQWTSGTLNIVSNVTWDSSANTSGGNTTAVAFGSGRTLGAGQTLQVTGNEGLGGVGGFALTLNSGSTHFVTGNLTVNSGGVLTQNPGSTLLTANTILAGGTINGLLTNSGTFTYQSGTFAGRLLNQGTVVLSAPFTAGTGVENDAVMTLGASQLLTANGQGFDNRGTLTLAGGMLAGTVATNSAGGEISGRGTISMPLTNNGRITLGGVITASTAITNNGVLTGAGSVNGGIINTASGSFQVAAGQQLAISGAWNSAGTVELQGTGALLTGGTITNTGTISGAGRINAVVTNNSGLIRAAGGTLTLAGANFINPSSAHIEVATGSTLVVTQGLSTNTGPIDLAGGSFDNNVHALNNSGSISGFGEVHSSLLNNTSNGLVSIGSGDMSIFGTAVNNGTVSVAGGRTLTFFNNVSGAGSYTGTGSVVYLGSFSPGNSPASVSFSGNVSLNGSPALNMEIGGTTVGTQYDHVHVNGALALGGALAVSLINGFVPSVGQSFDLLDWGTLSGTFSAVNLPTLGGGQGWDMSQLYTTGVVSVVGVALTGDYNNNGVVDMADYVAWRNNQGTNNVLPNDPIGGTIGASQYSQWRSHFGQTAGSGAGVVGSSEVPEPQVASLLGVLIGVAVCAARVRTSI